MVVMMMSETEWDAHIRATGEAWDEWHRGLHAEGHCHICEIPVYPCCRAVTKDGYQCGLRAKYGTLCGLHYKIAENNVNRVRLVNA